MPPPPFFTLHPALILTGLPFLLLPALAQSPQPRPAAAATPAAPAAVVTTVPSLAAEAAQPPSQRTFDDRAYSQTNQPALDAVSLGAPPVRELSPGLDELRAAFPLETSASASTNSNLPSVNYLPAPNPAKSWTEIYDAAAPAVLIIHQTYQCGRCQHWHAGSGATAFAISADGLIVTNAHVLATNEDEADRRFVVVDINGQAYPLVDILAADTHQDIAVARIAVPEDQPLPHLRIGQRPPAGAEIGVLSHPDGRYWVLTRGLVSRHHQYPLGGDETAPQIQRMAIDADYARGSSGGPVLNDQGEVVAMVATTTSVYYHGEGHNHGDNHHGENSPRRRENPLQMVFHDTVPMSCLWELREGEG